MALTLAVSRYIVRRDLWLGDRNIDLDAEKFGEVEKDRFFVLIKSVPEIPLDIRGLRREAFQIKRHYGVETYLAVVKYGGAEMLVDFRLQRKMSIDPDRFKVSVFGGPEPSPSSELSM
ncbi:hypothetical protein ACI7YU_18865 [Pseudomonas siliginis]|uniref:hypothetical protein n=1 Tax=Pseudomonas siliginis TaxID=2842346 RepID=UPI00386FC39D